MKWSYVLVGALLGFTVGPPVGMGVFEAFRGYGGSANWPLVFTLQWRALADLLSGRQWEGFGVLMQVAILIGAAVSMLVGAGIGAYLGRDRAVPAPAVVGAMRPAAKKLQKWFVPAKRER